jgi:hypothetical protein
MNHVETNHWVHGNYSGVEEDWNMGCPEEDRNWCICWELDKQNILSTQEQYNAGVQSAIVHVEIHQQLGHSKQADSTIISESVVIVEAAERELDEKIAVGTTDTLLNLPADEVYNQHERSHAKKVYNVVATHVVPEERAHEEVIQVATVSEFDRTGVDNCSRVVQGPLVELDMKVHTDVAAMYIVTEGGPW